jgi:hypothetical protein
MVGSSPPAPVRLSRDDTFHSPRLPRAPFEHFRATRTEPAAKILRLQQHRHAVVIGLHPSQSARNDDGAGKNPFAGRSLSSGPTGG